MELKQIFSIFSVIQTWSEKKIVGEPCKNGESNLSLPDPLNNVVPLIKCKLPQGTINTPKLVGRVEEGPALEIRRS